MCNTVKPDQILGKFVHISVLRKASEIISFCVDCVFDIFKTSSCK